MSSFVFEEKEFYYEEYGEGEPFLILNGIFMSCASWQAFIPAFSARNRLILLDMLDQGKSAKANKDYTQQTQVMIVEALLKHLKIESVNLLGTSYGGEIAMQFAIQFPTKVKRLILANTSAYTSAWLKDIGHSWEYSYKSGDGRQFFKTCIPVIYSPKFYEKNYAWMAEREKLFTQYFNKTIYDSFARLTLSAEQHNVLKELHNIIAPTLLISSTYDFITPPFQQTEIASLIPNAAQVLIQDAGHASMYEKPNEFAAIVIGFLQLGAPINIIM